MWKFRSFAFVSIPRLFFSPTRAAILTMCILGSSFSSSTSLHTSWSTRPLGWRPRVEAAEPYPFLTLAGKPLSSFLILLVTPLGLRQFSLTRLYLQLSWRLNSGFDPVISLTLKAWLASVLVLFQRRIFRPERLEDPSF